MKPNHKENRSIDYELIRAILDDRVGKVRRLLEIGANANIEVNNDLSFFPEMSRMGIRGYDWQWDQVKKTYTPLKLAVMRDNDRIVKLLLRSGADPNIFDHYKHTPLQLAVGKRHVKIVRLLLQNGADPNIVDAFGHVALMSCHSVKMAKILILAGADVNAGVNTRRGCTCLHYAAENGYLGIVKLLLRNGANPNVEDHEGLLPLHKAVVNNHIITARFLRKYTKGI